MFLQQHVISIRILFWWFISTFALSSVAALAFVIPYQSTATRKSLTTAAVVLRQEPLLHRQHRNHRLYSSPLETYQSQGDDENHPKTATTSTSNASHHNLPPIPVEWQGEVLRVLKAIVDPDLHQDIVTLGFVQNLQLDTVTRSLSLEIQLTTPACPVKDQFQSDCTRLLLNQVPWIRTVDVIMTAQEVKYDDTAANVGMSRIGAIIAVSSCKGGVGKSTTAVNLAYSLQALGARVGIFDADVYGPSLPTMISPDDDVVRFVGRQIAPLQRNGVQLMSFGYVNEGGAVMRGPMVTQLLDQFLQLVQWGTLDYLILDMPPGTGDIQLTLTQRLNITAAVIVTTPQELSFADVVRGVEMFDTVNVPCIAVVENMAYYQPPPPTKTIANNNVKTTIDPNLLESELIRQLLQQEWLASSSDASTSNTANGGDAANGNVDARVTSLAHDLAQVVLQHVQRQQETPQEQQQQQLPDPIRIFGQGHKRRLAEQWGIEHTFSMPLLEQIATNGDSGTPYVLANGASPAAAIYRDLAKAVVTEVAKIQFAAAASSKQRPLIEYVAANHVLQVNDVNEDELASSSSSSSTTSFMSPADLRRACRCAACVEEMTGRQLLVATSIPESVKPMRMKPCGNYAWSVDWSDGHRSLYPYRQIKALVQATKEKQQQAHQQQQQQQQQQDEKVKDEVLS